jgi:hypothetical protein
LLVAAFMPVGEKIGYELNGTCPDELECRSYYKTGEPMSIQVHLKGFEPGNYAVKIAIAEPDGNQLEREIPMDLGYQENGKDQLSFGYISKCKVSGTYRFDFYVDGELEQSFEWDL